MKPANPLRHQVVRIVLEHRPLQRPRRDEQIIGQHRRITMRKYRFSFEVAAPSQITMNTTLAPTMMSAPENGAPKPMARTPRRGQPGR